MAFNASEGNSKIVIAIVRDHTGIDEQFRSRTFPGAPCPRGFKLNLPVRAREALVICGNKITSLRFGNWLDIVLPSIRENSVGAFLIQPVDLPLPDHKDSTQDE